MEQSITDANVFANFVRFLHGTATPIAEMRVTTNKWIYAKDGRKICKQLFGGIYSDMQTMYESAMENSGAELSSEDGTPTHVTGVYVGINPPEVGRPYSIPVKNWVGGVCTEGTLDLKVLINNSTGYLTKQGAHRAIADELIAKRTVILIDIDSRHKPTEAATEKAKAAAVAVAYRIVDYLKAAGIRSVAIVDSGNGIHIYIPVSLPNTPNIGEMVIKFLSVIADKFSTEDAIVDTSVFNASRICRLPFTLNSKGAATDEIPWRMCKILELPEPYEDGTYYRQGIIELQNIASEAKETGYTGDNRGKVVSNGELRRKEAKLLDFFRKFKIEVTSTTKKSDGTYYYVECPWVDAPDDDAEVEDVTEDGRWITPHGREVIDCHTEPGNGTDVSIRVNGDGYALSCLHKHQTQVHWKDYRKFYDFELKFPFEEPLGEVFQKGVDDGLIDEDEVVLEVIDEDGTAGVIPADEGTEDERIEVTGAVNLSDLGNAKRLVRTEGHNIHYCQGKKQWYLWNCKRWIADDRGTIIRIAGQVVQTQIKKEAGAAAEAAALQAEEMEGDPEKARQDTLKRYKDFALASESKNRLDAMVSLAKSERGIPVNITEFDSNKNMFNHENGTINLETRECYPAKRSDLCTKISKVVYDPNATCPKFDQFLREIFGGEHMEELVSYMQRVVGYTMTASTSEQCYWLLYGTGANGKSTLLTLLGKLMGAYAQTAEFSSFIEKKMDAGIRNDLAKLCGARMVMASEGDQNKRMSEGVLKQVTGEDTITCRFLNCELFEYVPQFKLFLATNHKPKVLGQDHGFWRRVRLLPFTVTIPKEKQNKNINRDLEEELPGVLNWALEGLRQWQEQGLNDPEVVLAATANYKKDEDPLELFIEEECEVSKKLATGSSQLYGAYKRWAIDSGEFVVNSREFKKRMEERGFKYGRNSKLRRFQGIGLLFSNTLSDELVKEQLESIN